MKKFYVTTLLYTIMFGDLSHAFVIEADDENEVEDKIKGYNPQLRITRCSEAEGQIPKEFENKGNGIWLLKR